MFRISICNISIKNLDVSSLYNDEKKRFLQVDKSDFIFKFIVLFTAYLKTICAAIKRSCAASAITLVKDNTCASIIYSISLVNISCLLFSHRSFCIISCIYIMASEVKYKKKVVVIRVPSTVVQIIAVN